MSVRVSVPPPPTADEVERVLLDLLAGRTSREQASSWAEQWVMADESGVEDQSVWKGLVLLAGADLISTDRPYLHEEDDFRAWLEELRR